MNSRDDLIAAIRVAREEYAESGDETSGLCAIHRIHADGDHDWTVSFTAGRDFMTHLADNDVTHMEDAEIADMIISCWDSDWDDLPDVQSVGDHRIGSTDFAQRDVQRDRAEWRVLQDEHDTLE